MITTDQIDTLDFVHHLASNVEYDNVTSLCGMSDIESALLDAESVLTSLSGWEERRRYELPSEVLALLLRHAVDGVRAAYARKELSEAECEELYTAVRFLEELFYE